MLYIEYPERHRQWGNPCDLDRKCGQIVRLKDYLYRCLSVTSIFSKPKRLV